MHHKLQLMFAYSISCHQTSVKMNNNYFIPLNTYGVFIYVPIYPFININAYLYIYILYA